MWQKKALSCVIKLYGVSTPAASTVPPSPEGRNGYLINSKQHAPTLLSASLSDPSDSSTYAA